MSFVIGVGAFEWGLAGGSEAGPTALGIGAFGFSSGIVLHRARHEMARAIWWYNRDLPQ